MINIQRFTSRAKACSAWIWIYIYLFVLFIYSFFFFFSLCTLHHPSSCFFLSACGGAIFETRFAGKLLGCRQNPDIQEERGLIYTKKKRHQQHMAPYKLERLSNGVFWVNGRSTGRVHRGLSKGKSLGKEQQIDPLSRRLWCGLFSLFKISLYVQGRISEGRKMKRWGSGGKREEQETTLPVIRSLLCQNPTACHWNDRGRIWCSGGPMTNQTRMHQVCFWFPLYASIPQTFPICSSRPSFGLVCRFYACAAPIPLCIFFFLWCEMNIKALLRQLGGLQQNLIGLRDPPECSQSLV